MSAFDLAFEFETGLDRSTAASVNTFLRAGMYTNTNANMQGFKKNEKKIQFLSIRMNGKLTRCITFTYWAHEAQRLNTVKYIHNI